MTTTAYPVTTHAVKVFVEPTYLEELTENQKLLMQERARENVRQLRMNGSNNRQLVRQNRREALWLALGYPSLKKCLRVECFANRHELWRYLAEGEVEDGMVLTAEANNIPPGAYAELHGSHYMALKTLKTPDLRIQAVDRARVLCQSKRYTGKAATILRPGILTCVILKQAIAELLLETQGIVPYKKPTTKVLYQHDGMVRIEIQSSGTKRTYRLSAEQLETFRVP